MIYESCYWKDPLLKSATFISTFNERKIFREAVIAKLEREVMIGFYTVRKLIETRLKLSPCTMNATYRVVRYKAKQTPGFLDRWNIWDFYDFAAGDEVEVNIIYLCNQIIHSFVFQFDWDEDRKLAGVLFCSDRDRSRFCNSLALRQIADIFQTVGTDYPSDIRMVRDENGAWELVHGE